MTDGIDWLDEQQPHDPAHGADQIRGLLALLEPAQRILDLGCGTGRVLIPLAAAGHHVIGLDRCPDTLASCRARLGERGLAADLREADFLGPWPDTGVVDAVLCLGNTIMTVPDVDVAVDLLRRAAATLRPGAPLVIDDCPADFWPEVTEGNWLTGISETGAVQLVWHPSDTVFALRYGADVAPDETHPGSRDRRLRLWTDGALRLAARAAGLSAPERLPDANLLVMRPACAVATGSNASRP